MGKIISFILGFIVGVFSGHKILLFLIPKIHKILIIIIQKFMGS